MYSQVLYLMPWLFCCRAGCCMGRKLPVLNILCRTNPSFVFSPKHNISGCSVLRASSDMSWPYYFRIVLVIAVSWCENILLNKTFKCHHTGVHVQAPAFSSSFMLILFSTSYPGSRLKPRLITEIVAFIVKKAGSDIPTSCTVINPTLPSLMGHGQQNRTQTPLHHGVTQVQLRENKPAQQFLTPHHTWEQISCCERLRTCPDSEHLLVKLQIHN